MRDFDPCELEDESRIDDSGRKYRRQSDSHPPSARIGRLAGQAPTRTADLIASRQTCRRRHALGWTRDGDESPTLVRGQCQQAQSRSGTTGPRGSRRTWRGRGKRATSSRGARRSAATRAVWAVGRLSVDEVEQRGESIRRVHASVARGYRGQPAGVVCARTLSSSERSIGRSRRFGRSGRGSTHRAIRCSPRSSTTSRRAVRSSRTETCRSASAR